MSLVRRGRGLFGDPLGDLAVVGGRCLCGASFALRVSGPFSFATSSLFGAAPPSELQPLLHLWAGSSRCGVRPGGQGGDITSSSYPRLLQPSLCDSQGRRWVAPGDRPLAPQQFCGCLPFSYGDYTVRSPVSQGRGLDVSLDLQDTYLQVLVHPSSCRYLRFCMERSVFQFHALCFGLSTAPQVSPTSWPQSP